MIPGGYFENWEEPRHSVLVKVSLKPAEFGLVVNHDTWRTPQTPARTSCIPCTSWAVRNTHSPGFSPFPPSRRMFVGYPLPRPSFPLEVQK
jgi:hypothetical protein